MAKRKYKLTGFARFFIVLMFLAPIAYLAASYLNGEDGVENIRQLFSRDTDDAETTDALFPDRDKTLSQREELQMLRDSLRKQALEIQELKRQIRLLQGSSE